jgi:hypothetical protein
MSGRLWIPTTWWSSTGLSAANRGCSSRSSRPSRTATCAVRGSWRGQLRWYRLGLHNHHQGEDELIWPLLRARVNLEADVVLRMETQHERIAESLDEVMRALPAWQASASVPERDQLVAALTGHRAVLLEHLDDEEAHLLPVAGHHLNRAEWDALGEHFLATTPKRQLLIFLGAVLEDADMSERASVLTAMPAVPRWIWRTAGQQIYARRMRHLRGRP